MDYSHVMHCFIIKVQVLRYKKEIVVFLAKNDYYMRLLKRLILGFLLVLFVFSCATQKPKKRQQPRRGPIPCPVKDC